MSVHSDKYITSHYDPSVKKLKEALGIAKELKAPTKVIEAIEASLKLCNLRESATSDVTTKESEMCAKIVQATLNHDWKKAFDEKKTPSHFQTRMMSGHLEGQFLKSILSGQKAKRVLDIGMFTGYSAMSMAEALPADGKLVTIELQEYLKGLVEDLVKDSPHKDKIRIVIGPAIESMKDLKEKGETFDAVFMDAVKAEYKDYLKICLEDNLLSPGGTIIVDNAYMDGDLYTKPESPTAIFGDIIKAKTDIHVVLVPIRDGIYLIRRRAEVDGGVV